MLYTNFSSCSSHLHVHSFGYRKIWSHDPYRGTGGQPHVSSKSAAVVVVGGGGGGGSCYAEGEEQNCMLAGVMSCAVFPMTT